MKTKKKLKFGFYKKEGNKMVKKGENKMVTIRQAREITNKLKKETGVTWVAQGLNF